MNDLMDELIVRRINAWIDGQINEHSDNYIDIMEIWPNGQLDGEMNDEKNKLIHRWMCGCNDRYIEE